MLKQYHASLAADEPTESQCDHFDMNNPMSSSG